MAGSGTRGGGLDCVVVGAGLAGLACAHGLREAGRSVRVIEAEDRVGGRARTGWHRGRPVDEGFQVLLTAYPELRRLIRSVGIPRRDVRPVSGGAVLLDSGGPRRLSRSPISAATLGGLSAGDRMRLARLAAEVAGRPPERLLARDGDAVSAEALLRARGLSDRAIERVVRPLLGSILLDRELGADPGYLRFLLAMLVRGPAAIPSDGIGMVAEWTAAAVRAAGGDLRLGTPAAALETDEAGHRVVAVVAGDGSRVAARNVVLALDPPSARDLLDPVDPVSAARIPTAAASAATAAFALRRPLYRGRSVLVNADPDDAGPDRVDLLCQTTNITRPGAAIGPHILLATRVTTGGGSAAGLEEAVGRLVGRWAPAAGWESIAEPLGVREHPHALFRPLAGVRRSLPGPRTALANLVLAGDMTTHPSLEGAVASGARAARIVDALTP